MDGETITEKLNNFSRLCSKEAAEVGFTQGSRAVESVLLTFTLLVQRKTVSMIMSFEKLKFLC